MVGSRRFSKVPLLTVSKLLSAFVLIATLMLAGCEGGSQSDGSITSDVCSLGSSTLGDCELGSQ